MGGSGATCHSLLLTHSLAPPSLASLTPATCPASRSAPLPPLPRWWWGSETWAVQVGPASRELFVPLTVLIVEHPLTFIAQLTENQVEPSSFPAFPALPRLARASPHVDHDPGFRSPTRGTGPRQWCSRRTGPGRRRGSTSSARPPPTASRRTPSSATATTTTPPPLPPPPVPALPPGVRWLRDEGDLINFTCMNILFKLTAQLGSFPRVPFPSHLTPPSSLQWKPPSSLQSSERGPVCRVEKYVPTLEMGVNVSHPTTPRKGTEGNWMGLPHLRL